MKGIQTGAETGKRNWAGCALIQQFHSLDAIPLRPYYIYRTVHMSQCLKQKCLKCSSVCGGREEIFKGEGMFK